MLTAIGIHEGKAGALVITGNRAPTGPKPMVWNRVATQANSIAIWIRNTMSGTAEG